MAAETRIMFSLSEACSCGHRSPDRCRHELPRARRNKGEPGLFWVPARARSSEPGGTGGPPAQKEPKERIKSHSGFWLLTSGFHIPLLFSGIAQFVQSVAGETYCTISLREYRVTEIQLLRSRNPLQQPQESFPDRLAMSGRPFVRVEILTMSQEPFIRILKHVDITESRFPAKLAHGP